VIDAGISRALKQQGGILLVCAVHHYCVKSFGGKFLYGDERLEREFNRELQFTQGLRDQARGGLIGAKKVGTGRSYCGGRYTGVQRQVTDVIG